MKEIKLTQMDVVDREYADAATALFSGWRPQPTFGAEAETSARMKAKLEARRRQLEAQEK
jgi:BMFP domain-containing protein YqiC